MLKKQEKTLIIDKNSLILYNFIKIKKFIMKLIRIYINGNERVLSNSMLEKQKF